MKKTYKITAILASILFAGCASQSPQNKPSESSTVESKSTTQTVSSKDGNFKGQIIGSAKPGSKFSKLKIGMDPSEVQEIMGRGPDKQHSYESGKRWIPFYFGNDARRMQVLFKGEGCLIFTNGNVWGGAGGDLITIENDPSGACYQP